ncbi:MAG: hypothetical protein H0U18_06060 [Pyrinomonadaceae bacterium]|nr:hypothetical protein [Pyrinomonadaceae bacterium]
MLKKFDPCAGVLAVLTLGLSGAQAQTPKASAPVASNKTVKGSGTAGQIPKWIDTQTLGDSIITEANNNIGIGTSSPGSKLTVAGRVEAFTTGVIPAVLGQSPAGSGVRGNSDTGFGVFGSSTGGDGTRGISVSSNGVFGFSQSGNGVRGDTGDSAASGVFGHNSAGGGSGVLGQALTGTGVRGISGTGYGVFGSSDSFTAVEARSNTGFGVFGSSNTNTGVHGQSVSGYGVFGSSDTFTAVEARSKTGFGIFASSDTNTGVHGQSNNGTGIYGRNSSNGYGVWGVNSGSGTGVVGQSTNGTGVVGSSDGNNGSGVYGSNNNGTGVFGQSDNGTGLFGSGGNTGVFGFRVGLAGNFNGNVNISGTLSKGVGSFRIDHPLDPENKTLSHSFVESPDMMNIYNGNVTTDDKGEATVALPDYFAALNKDFRYQLTVIGQFAQAMVFNEISENRFQIKTDKPNVKVSWQVTGIRQDAWANKNRIPVEEPKPDPERGYYIHPELYDQPDERNVEWARHPELMKQVKELGLKKLSVNER